MNLEGISLFAIADYLKREITGSRIYKIGMPSPHTLYFSLKRNHDNVHLIIDINGASPAAWLSRKSPENPPEPPAFCMLLRKHLEEGKITQVSQYGLDRVIELEISLLEGSGKIINKQIVIELTGKNANLIFVSDGKIVDSMRHVSPAVNSVRCIQPGYVYLPPPLQKGFNILIDSPEEILSAIPDEVDPAPWKTLVSQTVGIGKATAHQLFAMAGIPPAATYLTPIDRRNLAEAITDMRKQFMSVYSAVISGSNQCQTIFPFPAAYIPDRCTVETFSTMNEAILYAVQLKPLALPEQEILKKITVSEILKTKRKIQALQEDLSSAKDADMFRITADSLMASLYKIPKGTKTCTIPNIYDGTPLQVSLSPILTPAENAQKYYKKYNKLKRAQDEVALQLKNAKDTLRYLESIDESLMTATTRQETAEIRDELQNAGFLPAAKRHLRVSAGSAPLCIEFSESTKIYVGKNNRQNDLITFKIASGNDLWFHAQKIPGSHVLVRTLLDDPEPEAVRAALQLAAFFSKARGGSHIPVDSVPRRYLKKPSGAKPGFVVFSNQKTFYVTPDEEYIKSLTETL